MVNTDSTTVKEIEIASDIENIDAGATVDIVKSVGTDTVARQNVKKHGMIDTVPKNSFETDAALKTYIWSSNSAVAADKKAETDTLDMPQYYREGFFSRSEMLHPELQGWRGGVVGDPMPYTIKNDNIITSLLIGCFILTVVAVSKSRLFMFRQLKTLFREPKSSGVSMSETTNEYHTQILFAIQTSLLLSVISFLYTQERIADTFILSSLYQLMAIFFGVFIGYFLLKTVLYTFVNSTFFDAARNTLWLKYLFFMISVEGMFLLPLVMLQSYFDLSIQNAVVYMAFVVALIKILILYKGFIIFFKQKTGFLQIFLYFCTLEIIPMLSLMGVMEMIIDSLKIKI